MALSHVGWSAVCKCGILLIHDDRFELIDLTVSLLILLLHRVVSKLVIMITDLLNFL